MQDIYMVVVNSQKINFHSYVKGQGHRDGTLLFEGTVISQKLRYKMFSIFVCRHLCVCPIKWNNKNWSKQRNDFTKKYVNIWRLTCKTPILWNRQQKSEKIWQSNSPVLLIFSISVPNLVTIGRHLTSFLTCTPDTNMTYISDVMHRQ